MERDKFLTEAMGECWHEPKLANALQSVCKHCKQMRYRSTKHINENLAPEWAQKYDFSTWQGFGKLWEWAEDQKWWDEFVDKDLVSRGHKPWLFPLGWIKPNNFANALYEFLKGGGR